MNFFVFFFKEVNDRAICDFVQVKDHFLFISKKLKFGRPGNVLHYRRSHRILTSGEHIFFLLPSFFFFLYLMSRKKY